MGFCFFIFIRRYININVHCDPININFTKASFQSRVLISVVYMDIERYSGNIIVFHRVNMSHFAVFVILIQLPRQNFPLLLEFAKNAFFRPRQDKSYCYLTGGEQTAIGGKEFILDSPEGVLV